jgi:hypothetical protein
VSVDSLVGKRVKINTKEFETAIVSSCEDSWIVPVGGKPLHLHSMHIHLVHLLVNLAILIELNLSHHVLCSLHPRCQNAPILIVEHDTAVLAVALHEFFTGPIVYLPLNDGTIVASRQQKFVISSP